MPSLSPPTKPCIGCGEERPTYRVGRDPKDRACRDCISSGAVPVVFEDEPKPRKSRRSK